MKEILNKILQDLKALVIIVINKLFKKAETYIPDDLGAKFKSPIEADPRDFKVENVLQNPTEEELKNLSESIDLLKDATPNYHPVYQGCVPSCTASSLSNYVGIQFTKKLQTKLSTQKGAKLLWEKMGHKWSCKGEHGDYLETALKTLKANGELTTTYGQGEKDETKHIEGYAYLNANKNNIKYWLNKGYPVYYAIKGNRNTWVELSKGEVKTYNYTPTGGHAITAIGYDKDYLYFINTWLPNDGDKYEGNYSVFKIRWNGFETMLKKGLANWRGWIVYLNSKKEPMFKDFDVNSGTEQANVVKNLVNKGLVKGVPHKDGKYLEPGRPITRMEVFVLLYRILKFLGK